MGVAAAIERYRACFHGRDNFRLPYIRDRERHFLLGGSLDRYSGFLPGLFEEALVTLQQKKPLFILGGFGGAAEVLARAVIVPGGEKRDESNIVWQQKKTPALATC
jgi:SLOG cluster2